MQDASAPPTPADDIGGFIGAALMIDYLFLISVLLLPPVVLVWWCKRRKIARGETCWDCGADLTGRPLYVDLRGKSRCPKCGNLMDVTDVYKMPPQK